MNLRPASAKAVVWVQAPTMRFALWTPALLVLLIPCALGCRQPAANDTVKSDDFHRGRTLVTQGKYKEAIPLLQKFIKEQPHHQNASRAGLFLGKLQMGLGDYDMAKVEFEFTIREYPTSLEAHKSRYKLAVIAMLQGDDDDAIKRFAELSEKPDGPLVPEAAAMVRFLRAKKPGGAQAEAPGGA